MPYQLLYTSVAEHDFSDDELATLLDQSRRANKANGITGLLIYFAPTREFFQLLEGEKEDVIRLMSHISSDVRHDQIVIEIQEEVAARSFGAWSMGFLHSNAFNPNAWPEYVDVLHNGLNGVHLTGVRTSAVQLLRAIQTTLKVRDE
jgi:hypothetical protein